ncbi:MAG: hypothetical protein LAP87_08400 [Acidobacteriia bacterium]|nr:hypothetical protein [Terriglobia bacterium]
MAFGKTAGCIILAGVWAAAAQFPVRHEHLRKGCAGVMTVDESGVSFAGERHAWHWKYQDIQELKLAPSGIHLLTYEDSRLRPGADREYAFTGKIPAAELYTFLRERMDQRFVAETAEAAQVAGAPLWQVPVKHRGRRGSQGTLAFGADTIVYATARGRESRTWRYADIDNISSSGPFQLTITTFERAALHYQDRKEFNFALKEPITEARYNQIWLEIEKKNGRIQ